MRVERRNGYRVIVGGPVPPQAEAITLGRTILVRSRSAEHPPLMAHELVHVRQFMDLGMARFLLRYVGSYLRFRLSGYGHMAAYRRIPLEVEASWVSRLHGVAELEPSASVLKTQLESRSPWRGPRSPRPVPAVGSWNRSKRSSSASAGHVARSGKSLQTALAN